MDDEIMSDSEWVNQLESDPYFGIPTALPQEVVETFTDYSSGSSGPMADSSWEEEFDYKRFDNLIYRPQTNEDVSRMQQAARALRAFAQEFDADRSHYHLKYEQAKYELEQQHCCICALDNENQDLTEQVCALATSNVQLSFERDELCAANIDLGRVNVRPYISALVFSLGFVVLCAALIIGNGLV